MKENLKKLDKKLVITSLVIFIIFLTVIFVSFALPSFLVNLSGKVTNEIESCSLDISLDEEDGISLVATYPMDDSEALNYEPYEITITNDSDCGRLNFKLNMAPSCDSCVQTNGKCTVGSNTCDCNNQIDSRLIKYRVVNTLNNKVYTGINPYEMEEVNIGLDEGETATIEVTLWISSDATNSDIYIDQSAGTTKDFCAKIESTVEKKATMYELVANQVNTNVTPNFQYKNSYNTDGINTNDNGVFLYNGTDDNGGTNSIYYYRGNVDNNVVFGGYCWKIIRTTSTGGVKLINNGEPYYYLDDDPIPIEQSDYTNISNSSSYPFTYNSTTKKWTSGNYHVSSSTSEISFTVNASGKERYYLSYSVSSEESYDYASFYKDGVQIYSASGRTGSATGVIDLGVITSSNVIKVVYSKNWIDSYGSDTTVFSIVKAADGSKKMYSCNNTGTASFVTSAYYNYTSSRAAGVGYMYGTSYDVSTKTMTSITDTYIYGQTVTYADGTYTLNTTKSSVGTSWADDKSTLANGYHYTCFTTGTTCTTVYYIAYFDSTTAYYMTFTGGTDLATAKTAMFTNTNDSYAKKSVDNWYKNNFTKYSNYLENTIFCNDRSLATGSLANGFTSETSPATGRIWFSAAQRMNYAFSPSLTCTNSNDKFSLKTANGGTSGYGNNKLTYPVALITADEVNLAGAVAYISASGLDISSNSNYYLYTALTGWTMTPGYWNVSDSYSSYRMPYIYTMFQGGASYSNGTVHYQYGEQTYILRPVISLKSDVEYSSGTGTVNDPYVVLEN